MNFSAASDVDSGYRDDFLHKLGKCGAGRNNGNACRDLHKLLGKSGRTLPLDISGTLLPIRDPRSRQEVEVTWPLLHLSAWAKYEFSQGGQMLLAGHHILQETSWRNELEGFWQRFKLIESNHAVFSAGLDISATIPYMTHGDEGRGRMKLPLLTLSFQGLLSHYGSHRLNTSGYLATFRTYSVYRAVFLYMSEAICWFGLPFESPVSGRHSFCSRLLFTVFPSQCYAKDDKSIYGLLAALAEDCKSLFENGLQAPHTQLISLFLPVHTYCMYDILCCSYIYIYIHLFSS